MKQLITALGALMVLAIALSLTSCSKSDLSKPVPLQQTVNSQEMLNADADDIVGRYKIARFIEDGKNETSRFTGYRFVFRADSDFIARTNSGQIVEGNWMLDTTGTILTIDISGTGSLDRLVDDWKIADVTSSRLVLVNADGDRVIFTRLTS